VELQGQLKRARDERSGRLREQLRSRLETPFVPTERWARFSLAGVLALALLCRSIKLMTLFPILIDEAIYMRWAEIIQHQREWFISLLDAKPPLLFWIFSMFRLMVSDPLLADRLVSLSAGCLTVVALYRVAYLCGGIRAGVIAAILYAVLPFGVLYDRLGYTDAAVNLCGACVVYSSISALARADMPWSRTLIAGLALGAGLFTKQTVLLYAGCPLAIGIYVRQNCSWSLLSRFVVLYATASVFLFWMYLAVPSGPMAAVNNTFLHHTSFFVPFDQLFSDPLINLRDNGPALGKYLAVYVGSAALFAASLGLFVLMVNRCYLPIVILTSSILPLIAASMLLTYFRSRYVFPCVWPLILVLACAASVMSRNMLGKALSTAGVGLITASMLVHSIRILCTPETSIAMDDAHEFLGPGPYSGFGVRDAVTFLKTEARGCPVTVLTDPWWGPPTDAVFAYLNQVNGIEVYEAWWLQAGAVYPLLPSGFVQVWKSQYQRIPSAAINFSAVSGLYYITDTAYHTPADIHVLDPSARLIRRFAKHSGREFIDVYRLDRASK
jgi:Dolichyl-phosphate-mannose-protein mannosyltransferase